MVQQKGGWLNGWDWSIRREMVKQEGDWSNTELDVQPNVKRRGCKPSNSPCPFGSHLLAGVPCPNRESCPP